MDLFDLLFLVVFVLDGLIIGALIQFLCRWLLGDGPLARLIRLSLSVLGLIGYPFWCFYLGNNETNMAMETFLFIAFAPIGLALLLGIVAYMFNNDNN